MLRARSSFEVIQVSGRISDDWKYVSHRVCLIAAAEQYVRGLSLFDVHKNCQTVSFTSLLQAVLLLT